jgi:hypothetical protein
VARSFNLGMQFARFLLPLLPSFLLFFSLQMPSQEIVPDELMDLYLSMTDSSKSQTVDSDLPYYCAFCLPGVVLTLGAKNWPLLRITFLTLSGDMQVH